MIARSWVAHPLLGDESRHTVQAAAAVVLIGTLVGLEFLLSEGLPTTGAPPRLVWPLDVLAALSIIAVALAAVGGVAYAIINAGPVMAALIPLGPLAVAVVAGRTTHPTVDAAVLLAGAAAGAGTATLQLHPDPSRQYSLAAIGIGVTAACGTLAAWIVIGLFQAGGPHLVGGLIIATLLLALAGLTTIWVLVKTARWAVDPE